MAFFDDKAPWFMGKLIQDFNLDKLDAAAIIGNAGFESGGFLSLQEKKPLVPGSKGGYGIMQWTGPRRRDFESYCSRNNLNPADMETNYKFLFVELSGPEGAILPKLKLAKTLDDKTEVFMKGFLRPGIPHLDGRQKYALRALQAYEKASPVPQVTIPTGPKEVVVVTPPLDHVPVTKTDPAPKLTIIDWIKLAISFLKGGS